MNPPTVYNVHIRIVVTAYTLMSHYVQRKHGLAMKSFFFLSNEALHTLPLHSRRCFCLQQLEDQAWQTGWTGAARHVPATQ